MTDLGLFLLMCAAICLLIGAIKFLAWVSDAVERHRAGEPWIEVRPMSRAAPEPPPIAPRSPAFTEERTHGSTAFTSPGTERTEDEPDEPGVQIASLDSPDLATIAAALERRGYLCLTPEEQVTARELVYRTEKRARFDPTRSKVQAVSEATGLKRGGSKEYQRVSAIYDAVIGKPPPAIQKEDLPQQEAVTA
jgi:hypothetical protein